MTERRLKYDERNYYISPLSITIALIFNYLCTGKLYCSKEKAEAYYKALRKVLTPDKVIMLKRRKKIIHITVRTHYYEELSEDVYEYDRENERFILRTPYSKGEIYLEKIWQLHINELWRKYIASQHEDFIMASISKTPLVALLGSIVAERAEGKLTKFVQDNTPKINPISIMLALTIQYLAFGETSCTNEQIKRYAIAITNDLSNEKNDFQYIFPSIEYDKASEAVYYMNEDKTCYMLSQPYCLGEEWLEELCSKYLSNLPSDFLDTAISMNNLAVLFATRIVDALDKIDTITKFITKYSATKGQVRAKEKKN